MTKKNKSIKLVKLFPNMVTILGLCLGLSAIRFALKEQWELAAAFIIFAAIIDAIDGRLARMLNASSEFGAQLDSLADFLNFGVAPPFILYLWITHEVKAFGWALVLFFAVCGAIRLARFNCSLEGEQPSWSDKYFVGMPAPAGAIFAIGPMITTFALQDKFPEILLHLSFVQNPWFVIIYVTFGAMLMASQLPTFSFKNIRIPRVHAPLFMALCSLLIIIAFNFPWLVMFMVGLIYYILLPVGTISYYLKYKR